MKLPEYAARNGIKYRAAWNRYRAGKIEGAYLDDSRHVVVPDPQHALIGKAAVYARVSTRKQRDDLERQAQRLTQFANAAGLSVVTVIKEIASGVNDTRPEVDGPVEGGLVGHVGGRAQGSVIASWVRLVRCSARVAGSPDRGCRRRYRGEGRLLDDFVSIIYSFAARLYGLRSARRRTDDVIVALGLDPAVGARLVTG